MARKTRHLNARLRLRLLCGLGRLSIPASASPVPASTSQPKGRVTQVHLKDLSAGVKLPEKIEGWWSLPVEAFASLGDGIIPTNPIIDAAKEAGVQYCHVEQDLSRDPVASIRRSLAYLRL